MVAFRDQVFWWLSFIFNSLDICHKWYTTFDYF